MWRRVVLASTSVIALAAAANAADIYRAPEGGYKDAPIYEPVWTGFYAGANGGYGSGSGKVYDEYVDSGAILEEAAKSLNPEGGFGGGQLGYNWQRGQLVYGFEADIQGANISGASSVTSSPTVPTYFSHGSADLDWFGTVRARAGVTVLGQGLLYATGGFAFGGVEDKLTKAYPYPSESSGSSSKTATGYVVGGGFEYLINSKWSAKAEYQYIDLGSDKSSLGSPVVAGFQYVGVLDASHAYNTVRLGLNYHFTPGYEPLK